MNGGTGGNAFVWFIRICSIPIARSDDATGLCTVNLRKIKANTHRFAFHQIQLDAILTPLFHLGLRVVNCRHLADRSSIV
jgi:hypothetical protein